MEKVYSCNVPEEFENISAFFNYADSIFTLILPFCVIVFLNIRIVLCVWKITAQQEALISTNKQKTITFNYHSSSIKRPLKSQRKHNFEGTMSMEAFQSMKHNWKCSSLDLDEKGHDPPRFIKCTCSPTSSLTNSINHMDTGSPNNRTSNDATISKDTGNIRPSCSSGISGPLKKKKRNKYKKSEENDKMGNSSPSHSQYHYFRQTYPTTTEIRVTKTLLLVSTVFLILNFPAHVLRAIQFFQVGYFNSRYEQCHVCTQENRNRFTTGQVIR